MSIFALLAQATAPAIDPNSITAQLGTVSGIVVVALGIVQFAKLALTKYKVAWVSKIPTPVICVVVSMALTLVANVTIKTLPGAWYDLIWQSALASASASGLFSWIKEPLDNPANKADGRP